MMWTLGEGIKSNDGWRMIDDDSLWKMWICWKGKTMWRDFTLSLFSFLNISNFPATFTSSRKPRRGMKIVIFNPIYFQEKIYSTL